VRLLGSGSYGRAFLVKEVATGEEWAIKQVDLADLSPQEQTDAMREAKILELLRHPNIVRFKEVYRTAKGKLNLVMEYAQGGDLAQRIKIAKQAGMPFSEEQVLSWFVQVCLAVRHLHDR
jgi:NIMA (never in mitosis gene a)-related kinase 1/4/5